MIEQYLSASILQARERARVLKGKIPNPAHSPEFVALQRLCESRIDSIIQQLDYLLDDPTIRQKDLEGERLRFFRRALADLAALETTGVAALSRGHPDDVALNRIIYEIHREIRYPLAPPTGTSLSKDYFRIDPSLGLLSVPLAESDFLLHLPDLYHELAHPLLVEVNNPKIEPFQLEFTKMLDALTDHFERERVRVVRSTGPKEYHANVLGILERSWMLYWSVELFCDMFAVYTVGPAYAWSHLHLTAEHNADPCAVRDDILTSHPPDHARMEAILVGLGLLGYSDDRAAIEQAWGELLRMTGSKPGSLYRSACPKSIIEQCAARALEGTKGIGCNLAEPNMQGYIRQLLNEAWQVFWQSPEGYHVWERRQITQIRGSAP